MGNILEIAKFKRPRVMNRKKTLSRSKSLDTNANNSSISTIDSLEFNWSKIESIYLGFTSSLESDLKLSLPMIANIKNFFDLFEEHLIFNSKQIYLSMTFVGDPYVQKFYNCARIAPNNFHISSNSDRMIAHVISAMKLHRLILFALEHNFSKAQEILDLIGQSHLIMGVSSAEFKLMDVALEKFLLQHKLITNDAVKIVMAYFTLITNYICHYINENKNQSSFCELSEEYEDVKIRRDKLKVLHKWHRFIENLRYETSAHIEELLSEHCSYVSIK